MARENMGLMQKRGAVLLLPFVLSLLGACASRYDEAGFPPERSRCTMEIAVPNMACETACPIKVHALLASVQGVEQVDVSFEERRATVEGVWPACGHKGMEAMLDSLATRGYQAQIVSSQ